MREYKELDKLADRSNARKFYETPEVIYVYTKIMEGIIPSLLNGSESIKPGDVDPDSPINDDGADVPLPDREDQ